MVRTASSRQVAHQAKLPRITPSRTRAAQMEPETICVLLTLALRMQSQRVSRVYRRMIASQLVTWSWRGQLELRSAPVRLRALLQARTMVIARVAMVNKQAVITMSERVTTRCRMELARKPTVIWSHRTISNPMGIIGASVEAQLSLCILAAITLEIHSLSLTSLHDPVRPLTKIRRLVALVVQVTSTTSC